MARRLVIFVLAILLSSEYWSHSVALPDEAIITYGCERILNGEWIYRDWDIHISPGTHLIGALWFSLCGLSAPAPKLLFSLTFALTALVIDLCAQRCLNGRWRYLPLLLWASCGVQELPILSYHWTASAAALATLYSLFRWAATPTRKSALLVGAATALAGWFLQSEGLVSVLMVLICWVRFRPARLPWVGLGCLLSSAILWAPLIAELPQFIGQNLEIQQHLTFNRKPYSWTNWLNFISHYRGLSPSDGLLPFVGASSHIAINAIRYLGTPLLWVWLLWQSEKRKDKAGQVLAYAFLAWWLGTANRHTPLYVSFLNPGWVLLIAKSLSLLPRAAWFGAALALLESAGWGARALLRSQIYIYPIATRRGVLYDSNPGQAALTMRILRHLQTLPPRSDVLVAPYGPQFYWMAALHNPSRSMTLLPRLNTPAALSEAVDSLEHKNVEWLVCLPLDTQNLSQELSLDHRIIVDEWALYKTRLTKNYTNVEAEIGPILYRRRLR